MLEREAMQRLIARLYGSVAEWCAAHSVDEEALEFVVRSYSQDEESAAAVVEAFRLGFEGAESEGLWGIPAKRREGPRYAVQFVVVDRLDGTPKSPVVDDVEDADRAASLLNEVDWPGPEH